MSTVMQAHLPGNYQLVDDNTMVEDGGVCKACWEVGRVVTTASLNTVWVSVEGQTMVWWICKPHSEGLRAENNPMFQIIKVEPGEAKSPRI